MTEKRKPVYDLDTFKTVFASIEKLDVTSFLLLSFKEKGDDESRVS